MKGCEDPHELTETFQILNVSIWTDGCDDCSGVQQVELQVELRQQMMDFRICSG